MAPSPLPDAEELGDASNDRLRFLEVVARRIVEGGYGPSSIRDLAREGGVSVHFVYTSFKSKAGALAAAIGLKSVADLDRSLQPGQIVTYVGGLWARYRERTALRALIIEGAAEARRDPAVLETIRRDQKKNLTTWLAVFRRWQADGGVAADIDVPAVVGILWAASMGVGVLEALDIDVGDSRQVGDLMDRFLRSLA